MQITRPTETRPTESSPATLVAILVAARKTNDRELERLVRRDLAERFGITLKFAQSLEQSK